ALEKNISQLDEVQYIAYGTQTKRFSVGNVTTVKGEDIAKQPVNNPMLALQGRVPGLEVIQETGLNGGAVKIRIQGENSIQNGNNPLIIIDGVPYPPDLPYTNFSASLIGNGGYGSSLSFVNMNDIESIDVLKDADATSIYGSRAANGAILITTKKGKPGKLKVNINLQQGWSQVAKKMEMLNTRQYLDMRYEAMKNAGLMPVNRTGLIFPNIYAPDLTIWDTTRFTDWQKELIGGTAQYANYNTSISGGTATSSYMVGLSFNRNTDVFPGDHQLKSGALHFNLNTTSLNQRFKMQLGGTYTVTNNSLPGWDLTADAIRLVPVAPPLIDDDTLNWAPNSLGIDTWENPLGKTFYERYKNNTRVLYANGFISYKLLQGLDLRCQFGYNAVHAESNRIIPLAGIRPALRAFSSREAYFNNSTIYTAIAEPQLTYGLIFGRARWDFLAGATIQQNTAESGSLYATGYTSDLLMEGIAGAAFVSPSLEKSVYKYNAVFARLGFSWDNKYLLSINGRRDGSSRFGPERRFHNFGSIGVGYIFSEEKWIERNLPWLSFGKLRASYGTTGSDQIGNYVYLSDNTAFQPDILYQGTRPMLVTRLNNPYVQWEETRKLQGGIDLGFWNDRILLSVTYAKNRSSNQLIQYILPLVTGFESITENFPAILENTSWEFMLNTVNLKSANLQWTSSVNLTIPQNKVVEFPNIEESSYAAFGSGIIVGQPKGVLSLVTFKGLDPATGR
ncbi:MAG: SusC/RagA family TonB-linked outer membrane protein, partial [Chitinophagaceae bacterium]|nr:SusC/RagA family TonB-linked outer membrane protein [Chitinophagaceae bacterium]